MRPVSKSRFRQLLLASSILLVALALAAPAGAIPVSVTSSNLPTCDPLLVPDAVDELGNQWAFPPDEAIGSVAGPASFDSGCSPYDPVVFVRITNLTARDFTDVWYVSDSETSLSNVDGLVNGEEAFKIDYVGINAPLISESIAVDGIFQVGETWDFVIDNYFNVLGLSASALASAGLVGSLSGGDTASSGSIIAIIPEPSTILLAGLGLAGLSLLARSRLKA